MSGEMQPGLKVQRSEDTAHGGPRRVHGQRWLHALTGCALVGLHVWGRARSNARRAKAAPSALGAEGHSRMRPRVPVRDRRLSAARPCNRTVAQYMHC